MTLSVETRTRIMNDVVQRAFKDFQKRAEAIFPGGLPGDVPLEGQKKLASIMAQVTDLSDLGKLLDPNYETVLRQGLDQPPVSPYLLNLLSVPGLFTQVSRDVLRLIKAAPE